MKEVLNAYRPLIEASDVLDRLELEAGRYVLVSAHREETVDAIENLSRLVDCLVAIAEYTGMPVIVSTHPRTRDRIDAAGSSLRTKLEGHPARFLKPFGFPDYVRLQTSAYCVASDSGTLTEEASILGFPAVMLREAHERPEGMDHGTLVFAGLNRDRVLQALALVVSQAASGPSRLIADYDVDDVSRTVSRVILSYVDYVNRMIWHKEARPERASALGVGPG